MSSISTLLATGYWLLATTLSLQIPPPPGDSPRSVELRASRDQILAREQAKLLVLGVKARPSPPDGSSRFVPLAEVVPARPKPKAPEPPDPREAIRGESAQALFDLATKAAKPPGSLFALADECLRDVIERRPDHAEARRILGFLPHQGGWATPHAADMLARKNVADPTYGWVAADWVPHLRRGELPDRGLSRWLPAAEADALRRDWSTRWKITTEHFRIDTNVPLNEAISFGRKLEDFHQLFFALMADVIGPDQLPLAQRFKSPTLKATLPSTKNRKYYQVYYYATRDEYAEVLAPFQGEDSKLTLGTYIPRKESKALGGVSYFFNDKGGQLDMASTLYHEASHQLLFESAGPDDYIHNTSGYWVFEGLGTYFETLEHDEDGSIRIGGLVGPRIAQAKRRLIGDREFVPIDFLTGMNAAKFRGPPGSRVVILHYAESMALAVFLMQAENARYRERFLDYALDAYKGRFRGSVRGLDDRLGVKYPDLDRQFLDYLGRPVASRP